MKKKVERAAEQVIKNLAEIFFKRNYNVEIDFKEGMRRGSEFEQYFDLFELCKDVSDDKIFLNVLSLIEFVDLDDERLGWMESIVGWGGLIEDLKIGYGIEIVKRYKRSEKTYKILGGDGKDIFLGIADEDVIFFKEELRVVMNEFGVDKIVKSVRDEGLNSFLESFGIERGVGGDRAEDEWRKRFMVEVETEFGKTIQTIRWSDLKDEVVKRYRL